MYRIIKKISGFIISTYHPVLGNQYWVLCKMRSHKGDICAVCGRVIGLEAFRPLGNPRNRSKRICELCAQEEINGE